MRRPVPTLLAALGCGLLACGDGEVTEADAGAPAPGILAGRLEPLPAQQSEILQARVDPARAAVAPTRPGPPPGEAQVPGQLLVTLRGRGPEALVEVAEALPAHRLEPRAWLAPDQVLVDLRSRATAAAPGHAETLDARDRLAAHPAVVGCEPNLLRGPTRVPDDPLFELQWPHPLMGMEAAWDVTVGDPSVVVAILDDGLNPHPDLSERVVPGYDLVTSEQFSGDGDGRDPLPEQVVGSQAGRSVWHGLHVAGIVGAATDNGLGLAGVDWRASLLPVRVLGVLIPEVGAGTSADVIAGIRWAVGAEVPGVPANPTPARVLNLSLGGGEILASEQAAIDEARARGATVVVAAGNDAADAGATALGGYEGVIVVGAAGPDGLRAPYSNYGPAVDLLAPGGRSEWDLNGDEQPDGVLSLWLDEAGEEAQAAFLDGTSMAAPHVAGVAALLLAVDPSLGPDDIEALLKETADPGGRCALGCGAGLLNAAAAVRRAAGDPTGGGPPVLSPSVDRLRLEDAEAGQLYLYNAGGGRLVWSARADDPRLEVVGPTTGELVGGQSAPLTVGVDRTGLGDAVYEARLTITSNGGEAVLPVSWRVGPPPPVDLGEVLVSAVSVDAAGSWRIGGATTTGLAQDYRYEIQVAPGDWVLTARADPDQDGTTDYLGVWPRLDAVETVQVAPGERVEALDFPLVPLTEVRSP